MTTSVFDNQSTTFYLTDSDIVHESFLDDINEILITGEIKNLFHKEDYNIMKDTFNLFLSHKKIPQTMENAHNEFLTALRDRFHTVISFSPEGNELRKRLQ